MKQMRDYPGTDSRISDPKMGRDDRRTPLKPYMAILLVILSAYLVALVMGW